MPNALAHGSFGTITTAYADLIIAPWGIQEQENAVFGLAGVTKLYGERSTRDMRTDVWIYNSWSTTTAVEAWLKTLEAHVEKIGTLTESGNIARTFEHVQFKGIERRKLLPDTNLGWIQTGTLLFQQLSP